MTSQPPRNGPIATEPRCIAVCGASEAAHRFWMRSDPYHHNFVAASATEPHKAVQDENMTIADGLSRCVCGRMIAEVGTVNDRHWLHVEESWNLASPAETPAAPRTAHNAAFGALTHAMATNRALPATEVRRLLIAVEAEAAALAARPAEPVAPDPFEDWSEVLTSDDAYEGGQADD